MGMVVDCSTEFKIRQQVNRVRQEFAEKKAVRSIG